MGEGSFGEVYKCIHKATNQIRAVKILKRNLLINPKIKQQFLQEFSILKKLDHPNILKIF
jgi:calcium-dependent protein kinase